MTKVALVTLVVGLSVSGCTSHSDDDVFAAIHGDNNPKVIEAMDKDRLSTIRDEFSRSPLMAAIVDGRPELVEKMLQKGVDANSTYEDIPMMEIAVTQRPCLPKIVRSLVSHGADIEVVDGTTKNTPILWAASMANSECSRELVVAGANLLAVDRLGDGLITKAVLARNESLAIELLNDQREFNPLSKDASRAMYFSASLGYSRIAEALLRLGVSGCVRSMKGEFPRDTAIRKNHAETAALLPTCTEPVPK